VRDNSKQTGVALEKAYQFTLWLIPTIEKFPRSQRFLLGDRIETAALGVVEGIVEATYTRNRKPILRKVNLRLEKLRLLFRLCVDLKLIDARRYEYAVRNLDEIGRLVGGWLKRTDGEEDAR
jgi:four helix bundle protein